MWIIIAAPSVYADGPHYCLGNALARLELKVMFEEFARRMPDVEPAGPLVHAPTSLFNFAVSYPIRFTPSRPV